MSSSKPVRIPTYRLHKATGQVVVTLNGKDHYQSPGHDRRKAMLVRLLKLRADIDPLWLLMMHGGAHDRQQPKPNRDIRTPEG